MASYPRRLYLHGDVIEGDQHARNSVVVENAAEEEEAATRGYRKAWFWLEKFGGDGVRPTQIATKPAMTFAETQAFIAGVVPAKPDADDQEPDADGDDGAADDAKAARIVALRADAEARGIKADGRWGEARLAEEIAKAKAGGEEQP